MTTQNGFTRKKVESLTLGEKLKKLRGDFRMSLSDISKVTKIQVKYLEFLENGEYEKLPADVYVRGFLRSYARYLNINEQAFIKLYERERNIQENLGHEKQTNPQTKNFSLSSLVITPRLMMMTVILVLVVGAFFYLYREFRSFASAPRLIIIEPSENALVEASELVVRGKTDKGARVSINNQPVFVASEGDFAGKLILQPGLNTITVTAVNRFEKQKDETLSVTARYTPQASDTALSSDTAKAIVEETFHIDVSMHDVAATISVTSDGVVVFSGILKPQETKTFEGKDRIVITSERGAETFVRFNGSGEAALSQDAGPAKDVIFTQTGKQG